jgi:hypothetical protein
MPEFRENLKSELRRILPDIGTLSMSVAVVSETGRPENYLVEAERCLDKINDAFKRIENLMKEGA